MYKYEPGALNVSKLALRLLFLYQTYCLYKSTQQQMYKKQQGFKNDASPISAGTLHLCAFLAVQGILPFPIYLLIIPQSTQNDF